MRKILTVASLTLLFVAGCSSDGSSETATPDSAPPTESETGEPPQQCLRSAADNLKPPLNAEALAPVIGAVSLPSDTVVISTVTAADAETPLGHVSLLIWVCSPGMDDSELRNLATAMAAAVEPAQRPEIDSFYVGSWVPNGEFTEMDREVKVENFESYLWSGEFADGINPTDRWAPVR